MVTRMSNEEQKEFLNPQTNFPQFSLTIPKPLDLSNMNLAAERFQLWKLKFLDFCVLTRLEHQSPEYQLAVFRQSVGDDALKVMQRFRYQPDEDIQDWRTLMNKLEFFVWANATKHTSVTNFSVESSKKVSRLKHT